MNNTSKKTAIVGAQIIILFVLVLAMFIRSRNYYSVTVNLDKMETNCPDMMFDGQTWNLEEDAGRGYVGESELLFGPNISLSRGSYTAVINYSTTEIQKGVLEVSDGVIDVADYFLLSNNKNEVHYDFTLSTNAKGFRFRLKEYYGGSFNLNGFTITRNNHDIRRLIVLWLILSIVLDIFLFNKYMWDNRIVVASIIGIAILASLPLFSTGIMLGNDLRFHLARIDGIVDGIKSGAFPVRMYPVFNDNYGYPSGILYGDLLLYIPAFFRISGFTILQSYKFYIFIINLLTAWIAYACGKRIFASKNTALIFSLAYTLSTYRLICIYARAAVGEYSATCFYPIIILAIWNIYTNDIEDKNYKYNAIVLAIGMAGLIYTHILSTEMVIIVLIFVALAMFKKTFRKQTLFVYLNSIWICFLVSAAFIIPFVEYYFGVDTMLDDSEFKSTYIQSKGAYISDYVTFFKSILGGNYHDRRGILTPGLLLMIGLFCGIYLIFKEKANKKIKFATVGSILSLFAASTVFPWNFIYSIPKIGSFLVSIQFPYRYIGMACCFLAVLLGFCIDSFIENGIDTKKVYLRSAIISIAMTLLFVGQYQDEKYMLSIYKPCDTADLFVSTRDSDFGMYIGYEYLLADTVPDKDALDYNLYGENSQSVILGENGTKMQLHVEALQNGIVEIPRFDYPYFVVKDKYGNLLSTTSGFNNRIKILFNEPYSGEVNIDFIEPWHWRFAEIISLITLIGIIAIFGKKLLSKRK